MRCGWHVHVWMMCRYRWHVQMTCADDVRVRTTCVCGRRIEQLCIKLTGLLVTFAQYKPFSSLVNHTHWPFGQNNDKEQAKHFMHSFTLLSSLWYSNKHSGKQANKHQKAHLIAILCTKVSQRPGISHHDFQDSGHPFKNVLEIAGRSRCRLHVDVEIHD